MTVTFQQIEQAHRLLADVVQRTPATRAPALSAATGAEVFLKLENLQVTGAFKARGAYVKLNSLAPDARARGVVAASAGNHAQGLAHHAGRMGIDAAIFMPEGTPFTKVRRTEALGATTILAGADFQAAREAALDHAATEGKTFIPPFDDPAIIAGQGTVASEFLIDVPDLDVLIAPVGGGGLMAGCCIAARHLSPAIELIAAQTHQYPSIQGAGHGTTDAASNAPRGITIADGIAVTQAGEITGPIMAAHLSDTILLEEQDIESAVRELVEGQCLVAEGAGAAGVAALLHDAQRFAGRRVGIVVSGGNIDSRLLASVLMRGLVRDGRLVRLRIEISDLPGVLSQVTGLIGAEGGNIVDVHHQRLFFDVPIRRTDLDVTIETVDRAHVRRLIDLLKSHGFEARELANTSL